MPLAASVRVYSTPDGRAAPLRPSILTASTSLVPGSFSVSLGQRLAMRHPASLISISPSPNLELRRTITPHWIPLGGYGVRSPPSPLIERRPCAIYLMSSADCHPPQAGGRDCFPAVGWEPISQVPVGDSIHSGGGIRTRDLRVMSPTSYLTAPPRGVASC